MLRVKIERLKPHPLAVSLIPPLTDEEYTALVLSVSTHGIIKPLDVIEKEEEYLVVDGCHRLSAARELRLKRVPVNVMVFSSDDEIAEYILTLQSARRNLTPSQKGAVAVEWMEKTAMDLTDAAKRFGVTKRVILEVQAVKKKDPEFYNLIRRGYAQPRQLKHLIQITQGDNETLSLQYDPGERLEKLEEEKDRLFTELQREKKIREDQREIKQRLRRLERERKTLQGLVKSLYSIAKEAQINPEKQPPSTREEIMRALSPFPGMIELPEGEEIPLTPEHKRAEELVSLLQEAISGKEADELVELLSRQERLPKSTTQKLSRLLAEIDRFVGEVTSAVVDISLKAPPETEKKESFLTLEHGNTQDHKTEQNA